MNSFKQQLQNRAGIAAFAASAVVFGLLSILKPGRQAQPSHILVPIVKKFVASGSHVSPGDIRWVRESRLRPIPAKDLSGYAKVPLFPGEILSPQNLGQWSQRTVLVAVAPTNAVDSGVARVGNYVDVMVTGAKGVAWQSGPLPVVGRSLGGGLRPSVDVAMGMKQALTFEQIQSKGRVELVGMTS